MSKATVNKKTSARTPDSAPLRLSLFDRPLASGTAPEKFTFYNYLTFKNIVLFLGVATLLLFLANAVSLQLAFLAASLIALFWLGHMEISSRRRWEKDLLSQLQLMGTDYERLVRDVARNRNDTAALRKKLSDAASSAARSYDKKPGEPVEQRMIKALIEQLATLGDFAAQDEAPADIPGVDAGSIGDTNVEYASNQPLSEDQVIRLVNVAVKQDRVDLFLQPIVGLPQRKVRFYEMFSRIRIRQDNYLPAVRYIDVAHKRDLMPIIDNLLLLRGLQIIRSNTQESNLNRAFFFNITSLTLNDPKFMGDLVEFISQNRALAPRLIFEMGQKDLSTMSADVLPILNGLSKLGCRFSMDQVKSLVLNFDHLEARHIRFVKADASLLLDEMHEIGGLQRVKRLKGEFDRRGVDLIIEKIETERQLVELMEVDIDYGQGYLFGKPVLHSKT